MFSNACKPLIALRSALAKAKLSVIISKKSQVKNFATWAEVESNARAQVMPK